jgi:hypothetical protein
MSSKVVNAERRDENNYVRPRQTKDLNVLVPTKCKDYTVQEIYSFIYLLKGKVNVDFFHTVPLSLEELCDCVDMSDIHYDRAVAEKRLYSFVKKFPKMENVTYDYKIANGDPKSSLKELIEGGNYDMVALEVGEFCHYGDSLFDVIEIVSSINIPVVVFGNKNSDTKIAFQESNAEVIDQ